MAELAVKHPRVTKRRAETRERLLAAALEVFSEEGFGRASVDRVCARAGFTRGAFYSNFDSLDELFLAMWEQRSQLMIAEVASLLKGVDALDPDNRNPPYAVRSIVEKVLAVIPVDDLWFRINSEFTAHALRNPALRQAMTAREEGIAAAMTPIVAAMLQQVGREVIDRVALGRALVAVHDGTAVQCLLEPENPLVAAHRIELFTHVVTAYSINMRSSDDV